MHQLVSLSQGRHTTAVTAGTSIPQRIPILPSALPWNMPATRTPRLFPQPSSYLSILPAKS
ncbi:predicted protein [Botrytis cinerea T4]|uniref:Uncharacterized protein n=1 Tax=Botryotinia fuckeliana (strain T4) TaxID=999810 RepID=G2Y639_BOTF4|nr:predicted protein [Botrytis cinerea T4]